MHDVRESNRGGIIPSKWYGDSVQNEVETKLKGRLERATRHLANCVKKKLSQNYPPASTIGNAPHLRTGELRRSIATEVIEDDGMLVGRVGTAVEYAKYLELEEHLDRPFLRTTLQEQQGTINNILTSGKLL